MASQIFPGFIVLQGNQLESLRDLLVHWLSEHPLQPLESECILVQSNGIAQWLKMALASDQGCGIAAGLDMQLPGRFVWSAYRSLFEELPRHSPFDKSALVWRLYRLFTELKSLRAGLDEPDVVRPLQGFLEFDKDPRRHYQLALRLADLYDQYQVYRADWLEDWAEAKDQLRLAGGGQRPLEVEQRWQSLLWRLLLQEIADTPDADCAAWPGVSRAQVHQAFIARCAELSPEQRPEGLPRRVIVFGISSLPKQILDLLQAIARFTQVMIFTSNPCQAYWGDIIEGKELLRQSYRRTTRRKPQVMSGLQDLHVHGHALLAAWGKQGRDYLHLLDEKDQPEHYRSHFNNSPIDIWTEPGEDSLLHQLQHDILHLESLQDRQEKQTCIDPRRDRSLQFLVAHSPQREVEILHDQLLDAFAHAKASGTPLAPRDVLVMVPDINGYAAHIQAVFGRHAGEGEGRDERFLPFHISDQGQRQHNSLLIAFDKLLHLPKARFAVSELLDLLDTPALRRRYGLDAADIPLLRQWITDANIRWGLDAEHRHGLGLPQGLEQNTWRFGLQRMLLGYALGDAGAWQGIEPYADMGGLEAALLGPLAQLLRDLEQTLEVLTQSHTAADWVELLQQILQRHFVSEAAEDSWALDCLEAELEQLLGYWRQTGLENRLLHLEVVREALLSAIDQPRLTQKFLAGAINFATLMPMRAVPFRQIWLLGMNDGDYPRQPRPADFDLMARDYRPGDRARREDDRYLFLEALLSARERLVISWVGRGIQDNAERPASVLVAQLRDHIASGWRLSGDEAQGSEHQRKCRLLDALTTEHPLQPFSRSYFDPARDPRLFSYASEWRRLYDAPLSIDRQFSHYRPDAALQLGDLAVFLRQPIKTFYQRRLGVRGFDLEGSVEDTETFAANSLQRWSLRRQLLEQALQKLAESDGLSPEEALQHRVRRIQGAGLLPMPPFGPLLAEDLVEELLQPLQDYLERRAATQLLPPQTGHWCLNDTGLELQASLTDLRQGQDGERLRLVLEPSDLQQDKGYAWHRLLQQWPMHLFAQCQGPLTSYLFSPSGTLVLPSVDPDRAEALLLELLRGWHRALQSPLPLPCKTAFAFLTDAKPELVYQGGFNTRGEIEDHPAFARFWPDFGRLTREQDFVDYSQRLYGPLVGLLMRDGQQSTGERHD